MATILKPSKDWVREITSKTFRCGQNNLKKQGENHKNIVRLYLRWLLQVLFISSLYSNENKLEIVDEAFE